jgi:phosphatidylinositol alpha-mannosyltransferase
MVLLQAVRLLAARTDLPPFRVVICGKGHLEPTLKQYVRDNNLQDIVTFTGFITEADKPRYYASADISVFPSSGGESFGIVLLEAMASGKAVVLAGDNPGYRSVVGNQPELLFEPANAGALADKIARYTLNSTERKSMAIWGEHYTAGFDIDTVGSQLLNIYNEALHKRRNT